jgi:hypothetical protein
MMACGRSLPRRHATTRPGSTILARVTTPTGETNLNDNDSVTTKFDSGLSGKKFAEVVAHEGRHVADAQAWVAGGECTGCSTNLDHDARETRAWAVSSYAGQALGSRWTGPGFPNTQVWNRGWKQADLNTRRANGIVETLKVYHERYPTTMGDTYSKEHHHIP